MEDIIASQVQSTPPDEVEDLNLEEWKGRSISLADKRLLEKYHNIDYLAMSGCGLETLDNFPLLPKLIKLDLNENNIRTGLSNLSQLTELLQLSLINNKIENASEFQPLENLGLSFLEIDGCPLTGKPGYREQIFKVMEKLTAIDGIDKDGKELLLSDEDEDFVDDDEDSFDDDDLSEGDSDISESADSDSEDDDPRTRNRNNKASKEPQGKKRGR
jgi:hypothetical protein